MARATQRWVTQAIWSQVTWFQPWLLTLWTRVRPRQLVRVQTSRIPSWTTTLGTMRSCIRRRTTCNISFVVARLRTGRPWRSSGIAQSTRNSGASPKSTGSSWLSLLWTLPKTESRWPRSCSRHSMSRAYSLVCRPLSLSMPRYPDPSPALWARVTSQGRLSTQVMVSRTSSPYQMASL